MSEAAQTAGAELMKVGTDAEAGSGLGPAGRVTAASVALVLLSLVMVSGAVTAGGGEADFARVVVRRLIWGAFGTGAFLFGLKVPYDFWGKNSCLLLGIGLLTLVMVLIPSVGTSVSGARRWIRLGPGVGFQPSQYTKVALVIWLAAWCARCKEEGEDRMSFFSYGLLVPGVVTAVVLFLLLLEPDFGTAALTGGVAVLLLVVSGASVVQAFLCMLAAAPIVHLLVVTSPYRMQRISTFMDPLQDVRGSGYQLVQSLAAIASGGVFGKGPGEGGVAHLPAAANDFVFSVIARQLGFIGALAVVALFVWLLWEGMAIALRAPDMFGFSLAFGITALICAQAALHILVATGSAPTTGVSMPLVSSGGSSLFFTLWALGILCNIANSEGVRT